ncbi:MAG: NAD(P)/FAD-dependent oxidoreductase [Pyrinomonadaceae bacterium]
MANFFGFKQPDRLNLGGGRAATNRGKYVLIEGRKLTLGSSNNFDVAIAGGGPAGASAAIHLALKGARVLLIEEKKFPRPKLCGEFISPECLTHFKRLGVLDKMRDAGGSTLCETVFYSRKGNSVAVPSEWFKPGARALGLSRSEMDQKLLERAKSAGVTVLEEAHATPLIGNPGHVHGLRVKTRAATRDVVSDYPALVTIDATGRVSALSRQINASETRNGRTSKRPTKRSLVAFKAHMENSRLADGACEIYFYRGGYGGLSSVEGELTNLCFIVSAEDVRHHASNPEIVMREIVMKNVRAAYTLEKATSRPPWLSVSLDGFGRREPCPAVGLLTVGDAAAFIDPFTGSGMLMALESGVVAAEVIARHLVGLRKNEGFQLLACEYRAEYFGTFNKRLRISSLLRRAAFVPRLAEGAIFVFGLNAGIRRKLARATRRDSNRETGVSGV